MTSASSHLEKNNPELPAAYDLMFFDQVESIRSKAIELANQGYQEGTIIWALDQTNAKARLNKDWQCNSGDLHCAVILQPDYSPENYGQILLVAVTSLGNAIATNVTAMTALGYNWPNDVSIANHKIASVWLDQGKTNNNDWLIVSLSVNVESAPQDHDFDALCIQQTEGANDVTNNVLLEAFAREFIKQLNLWDERGFEYIHRQWKFRWQDSNSSIEVQTAKQNYSGITQDVNTDGSLSISSEDSNINTVSINEYMELN